MGNEFFWFLDILVVAVIAVNLFRGAKKGAVGVLISALSVVVAFIVALTFNGPAAEAIYNSTIRQPLSDYIDDKLNGALDREIIAGLSGVDLSKAKIKDHMLDDLDINFDEKNTATVDLSIMDLSETGISGADLTGFGIGEDFDTSEVKIGKITFTRSELEKYGFHNIVLARVITTHITDGSIFKTFSDIGNKLSETFSISLNKLGKDLSAGSSDAIYTFVVSIITVANTDYGERIMNDIITPTVLVPLKVAVFLIIFALVILILNIIASVSKIINKIPVISSVNSLLGGIFGLLEAFVVLMVICAVMKFFIGVCGDSLVFINETTINRTFLFRHIYMFDPFGIFRA